MILIIVRHPDTKAVGRELRISAEGAKQMGALVPALRRYLAGKVRFLSSTAPRATDGASMLVELLGRQELVERHKELEITDPPRSTLADALRVVRAAIDGDDGADVVVVVTHLDYAEDLPPAFAREVLGKEIPKVSMDHGQARLIYGAEPEKLVRLP